MSFSAKGIVMKYQNILLVLFSGLALLLIIYLNYEKSSKPKIIRNSGSDALREIRFYVMKHLEDHTDAKFPKGGSNHVTSLGRERYKVDSWVWSDSSIDNSPYWKKKFIVKALFIPAVRLVSFCSHDKKPYEGIIEKTKHGWHLEYLRFK